MIFFFPSAMQITFWNQYSIDIYELFLFKKVNFHSKTLKGIIFCFNHLLIRPDQSVRWLKESAMYNLFFYFSVRCSRHLFGFTIYPGDSVCLVFLTLLRIFRLMHSRRVRLLSYRIINIYFITMSVSIKGITTFTGVFFPPCCTPFYPH